MSLNDGKYEKTWLAVMIAFIFLAILFNLRSWIIQCVIWAVVYSFYTDRKRGILRFLKIAVVIILVVFVAYELVGKFSPDTLDYFLKKLSSDTRSGQYTKLLSQVKPWKLVVGQGYDFSYYDASMGWLLQPHR